MNQQRKTYIGFISSLPDNGVFVFGSNTEGIHGAGAAKVAVNRFGAVLGQPAGFQGKSFAIITKDLRATIHPSITKEMIIDQIKTLYRCAETTDKDKVFYITHNTLGVNLCGYSNEAMAEMYAQQHIPENIVFEEGFLSLVLTAQKR